MKLLISLISFVALGGALAAGTFAVFTDIAGPARTTFAAGNVDIAVNGQNPWTEVGLRATSAEGATALKPSQTGWIEARVRNVGDNPIYLWKRIGNKVDSGGSGGYDCPGIGLVSSEPECEAEQALGRREDGVSYVTIYDLVIQKDAGPPLILRADGGVPGVMDGDDASVHGQSGYWTYLGGLLPGEELLVRQSFHLDSTTGNFQQGDVTTFNLAFYASQVEGACRTPAGAECPSPMPSIGTDFPE
ncbi:MAG: hypothetical protein Q8O40_12260 [Chloroflexota bacterium]|nr:hypothetical protein [Chloroflexota bacterium]